MELLVLLCLVGVALGNIIAFDEWAREHGKEYSSFREKMLREAIWTDNMMKILAHNVQADIGEKGYRMGMNEYGDMTQEEFRAQKTCMKAGGLKDMPKVHYEGSTFQAPLNQSVPVAVDFSTLGYVTPIKNQGSCGSCWAFSTTGSLEGQIFRKTGKLVSLSEQQLVDCAGEFGNLGCDGGLMDSAFTYLMSVKGLMTEKAYPYTAEDGKCKYDAEKAVSACSGFLDIPSGKEDMLVAAIAANGPVSVAIDASHHSFQFYSSGVYNEPACSSTQLDHGVLAVGYSSLDEKEYYIVKNSWGESWGDKGYILMSRNKDNQCGIATDASLPLV